MVACGNNDQNNGGNTAEPESLKLGLGVLADASSSKLEINVSYAAVLLDKDGKIVDCYIDAIAATAKDNDGTIDVGGEILTKNEKGDDYGMVAWGGAIAEWYAQVDAFEAYCIGKTVDEILNGALTESGYAADADLATSATINLFDYVSALDAAYINAQVLGAEAGDELVLSCTTSQADSAQGNAQLNVDAVALTVNGDGVITSCQLDSLQGKVAIDENGAVGETNVNTKNTLGFDYGMVAWAGAKYEWFEQAANFASYITGKTAAEVAGIAIDEATKPADADLATSVTISIYGFKALIAKALG